MTSFAISSTWRGSSPKGQKWTRWHPARAYRDSSAGRKRAMRKYGRSTRDPPLGTALRSPLCFTAPAEGVTLNR
jgi:hypothetical protein